MSNYYNENAQQFINDTLDVDMSSLYDKFLPLIPAGGAILDAGCGSGRDSKYFKDNGFTVHAFDASPVLAQSASKVIGIPVDVSTFLTFKSEHKFDAIWACASLLHVSKNELNRAIENLIGHLKSGGLFYVSFKYGDGERTHNGRRFTDMNEASFSTLVSEFDDIEIKSLWLTGDKRPERSNEQWLNALIYKV